MKRKHKFPLRLVLEIFGTVLLLYGAYTERHVLAQSLHTIRTARVTPLLVSFLLTWLLFVWSATGYKSLLKKPIRLWHIMLAHLAAGGPGRVIPGGGGYLSFGTMFLRKSGLTLPQALAVALSNNLSGFLVNVLILLTIFTVDPDVLANLPVSRYSIMYGLEVVVVFVVILLLARRSRRFKKGSDSTGKEVKKLWQLLLAQPQRIALLVFATLATIATNGLMLHFAASAVGLTLPITTAIVAVSTGVALGSILPTPGGIGGVEAGLIASMFALLGANLELVTSAALLYRFATYVLPLLPGVVAYFTLRKRKLL